MSLSLMVRAYAAASATALSHGVPNTRANAVRAYVRIEEGTKKKRDSRNPSVSDTVLGDALSYEMGAYRVIFPVRTAR